MKEHDLNYAITYFKKLSILDKECGLTESAEWHDQVSSWLQELKNEKEANRDFQESLCAMFKENCELKKDVSILTQIKWDMEE